MRRKMTFYFILMMVLTIGISSFSLEAFAQRKGSRTTKGTTKGSVRHSEKHRGDKGRRDDRGGRKKKARRGNPRQERYEDARDRRRYRALVRLGAAILTMPRGHTTVIVGGGTYYYHGGVYYQQGPSGYVVIGGPIGARVTVLPTGYSMVPVGPTTYYYYYGNYYRYDSVALVYIVIAAPQGAIVPVLPNGYSEVYVNRETLYVVGEVSYRPVYRDGVLVYVVL